jgi:hypothetical protein
VQRHLLASAAALLLAVLLVPAALAARVSVRVEGKTTNVFGALQTPFEAGTNLLQALEAASLRGEFYYHVATASFGRYVDQIGRYPAAGASGWWFKVNGAAPPVGAENVQLRDGDRVLWYWGTFGGSGGPPTLLLIRRERNCYRVVSENDAGTDTTAIGAVLQVDGRRVRTRSGRACVGRHSGLVHATLPGAVRSNALR